jgi:hypothetical protein
VRRPLESDDRHRLVEAMMRVEAMKNRQVRDLLLANLEAELGHRLVFDRYDQDKLDMWSLVEILLDHPGAAQMLVQVLKRFYPGSLSVEALGDLVRELVPEAWLDQGERRELHRLMASLERVHPDSSLLDLVRWLCRRVVGPAWPGDQRIRSLHEAVALMEAMSAGPDRVPPLLAFVGRLADVVDSPQQGELQGWVDRQATLQGVSPAPDRRQAEVGERGGAKSGSAESYLIIECKPDYLRADRYLVTAWLQVDREPGTTLCRHDDPVPFSRVPELLDELLNADTSVIGRPVGELTIEFALPRPLLNRAVEQVKVRHMEVEHRIGIRYPVVVRSLDRMRDAASHHPWKNKWKHLCQAGQVPFTVVRRRGEYGDEEVLLAGLEASPAVLALAFPPPAAGVRPDEHWVGVVAGTPVIVWCREGRDPARFAREVEDLLAEDLRKLPRRVMELRQRAVSAEEAGPDHLGLHLTLLFDDADRVPEPYVPLQPPA